MTEESKIYTGARQMTSLPGGDTYQDGKRKLDTGTQFLCDTLLVLGTVGGNNGGRSRNVLQIKVGHVLPDNGLKPFAFQIQCHVIGRRHQKSTCRRDG